MPIMMIAVILKFLFGYKVLDNKKSGFPDNAINKVVNKLEEMHISYQIIYVDKNPVVKNYKKLNKYDEIRSNSLKAINQENRVDLLVNKIKEATPEQIDKIIESMEKCLG